MTLTFDLSDFQRMAKRLGAAADQIPFALATALNTAADATRKHLVDDVWPSSVVQRNKTFISAALTTKGQRATKANLSVTIYDQLGRASLKAHATGGRKVPKGSAIAVPDVKVRARRGARGVPKNLRPLALTQSFKKGDVIYQRTGKQGRRLKLMYVLKPSTNVPADVPFDSEFQNRMRTELRRALPVAIRRAMATRRG